MFSPYHRPVQLMPFQVYDLEWYPKTYQLRLVGTHNGERYRSFTAIEDFLDGHVFEQPSGTVLFAHAGGSHDVQFPLLELIARCDSSLELSAVFSGASAILVRVKRGRCHWLFCDSFWLMRDSLANIAKSLGIRKGGSEDWHCPSWDSSAPEGERCEHEREKLRCVFYAPLSVLRDYNELDCLILFKALERLQDELLGLGGELRYTIASCAMRLFRREFLTRSIQTNHVVNDIARQAYIASRVEVIRPACKGPAYWYDINSSFPASGCEPQPANLLTIKHDLTDHDRLALVQATVKVPPMYLPPLGYRQKHRIYFPTGKWKSWFDVADIRALEEAGGRILKVEKVFTFHGFDDIARYNERIYSLRKASNDPFQRIVLKYLLNSLYGKTAEKREKEKVIIDPSSTRCPHKDDNGKPGAHIVNGVSQCMTMLYPRIWQRDDLMNLPHEHVPIAAHITALSRQLLGGYMNQALKQGGRLYYCDTDGFPTEARLPASDDLGSLKLEKMIEAERWSIEEGRWLGGARFLAPKFYRVGDSVRSKGFSRLTRKDFDQVETRPKGGIQFTRMLRLKEMFKSGELVIREKFLVKRLLLDETRTKRCVSGNDSRPWDVEEIEGDL